MKETFYSNGKLLLTGEYVVLDGAMALALPTKLGQSLVVENGNDAAIQWKSFDADGSMWFEDSMEFSKISANSHSQNPIKNKLIEILYNAFLLNPEFLTTSNGYTISTNLTFPRNWGLGTSSTLINNIAQWLKIDAYELLKRSFGGSGYDIACAQNNSPVLFRLDNGKPVVSHVAFHPQFISNLYFVYLNKKQSSKSAIEAYYAKQNDLEEIIPKIDSITSAALNACNMHIFKNELEKHERILSAVLDQPTIKESLFPDFNGTIKSLGAWGGDFILAISDDNPTHYFYERGFKTIYQYNEFIL